MDEHNDDIETSNEPGDDFGNRLHVEQEPDIDDNIGNRLSPVAEEPHIDDDIGNRALGSGPAPSEGSGGGRRRGGRSRGRRRGGKGGQASTESQARQRGGDDDNSRRRGGGRRRDFERAPVSEYVLKSDPEDKRSKALEICTEVLRLCQREAEVSANLVDEAGQPKVVVMVDEADSQNALFTRNSAALSALNFLTNKVVNRFPDDRIRLVVHTSSGSAPSRRRERLATEDSEAIAAMALRLADLAVQNKQVLSVAPMRSELRRVIHVSLENHDTVITMSEGEGAFRKLLIVPKSMLPMTAETPRAAQDVAAPIIEANTDSDQQSSPEAE